MHRLTERSDVDRLERWHLSVGASQAGKPRARSGRRIASRPHLPSARMASWKTASGISATASPSGVGDVALHGQGAAIGSEDRWTIVATTIATGDLVPRHA